MTTLLFDGPSLRAFYANALRAAGVPLGSAEIVADGIYYADLAGIDSHGALNFDRIYLPLVESGQVDVLASPRIVEDQGACTTIDGGNGLGFVTGRFAMGEAIRRADLFGIGASAVRNSTHAGSMGFYTRQAIATGMVAIAMTNLGTQRILRPPGGGEPLVGTNVFAAAAPAGDQPDFSLDMSTAVVSAGRVRLAARRGESLPAGWLVDNQGQTVNDPAAYDRGEAFLQVIGGAAATGGYKGFGLALLAEILCGVLPGAAAAPLAGRRAPHPEGREDQDIGHFFLALRVSSFRDGRQFRSDLDGVLSAVRNSRPAAESPSVSYPGLPEADCARRRHHEGIPLDSELADGLLRAAQRLCVPPPRPMHVAARS